MACSGPDVVDANEVLSLEASPKGFRKLFWVEEVVEN
jgi:hypothetical protein